MRIPCLSSVQSLLFIVVTAAACSSAPIVMGTGCDPACAAGTVCDAATMSCVPSVAPNDLSVAAPPDLAGCQPGCQKPTPYCNTKQKCVACLTDDQCPFGNVCRTSGNTAVCVPGCMDDTRCGKLDGGAGQSCCAMACIDTSADPSNCGGCGVACMSPNATSTCSGGACQLGQCNAGFGNCNKDPKDGCEVNFHVDVNNCSACGQVCKGANAIMGCSDGCYLAACNYGYDDCNGDPKDGCEAPVLSDVKNCGKCQNKCPIPPHGKTGCQLGGCTLTGCDNGYFDCDGVAANGCETVIATDAKNCGACGVVCPMGLVCQNNACTCPQCNYPNAKSMCVNNVCQMGACLNGFADCNMKAADGCEINISSDKNNCGACGAVCPMNMPACVNGACAMGCLNGMMPPNACDNGADPQTGDKYTICTASCTDAWLSATQQGGGNYHILEICQNYGYSNYGMFGGTCGNICGYCVQGTSCMSPQMNTKWDGGGMNCGKDQFGPILCKTVQWQCIK